MMYNIVDFDIMVGLQLKKKSSTWSLIFTATERAGAFANWNRSIFQKYFAAKSFSVSHVR